MLVTAISALNETIADEGEEEDSEGVHQHEALAYHAAQLKTDGQRALKTLSQAYTGTGKVPGAATEREGNLFAYILPFGTAAWVHILICSKAAMTHLLYLLPFCACNRKLQRNTTFLE